MASGSKFLKHLFGGGWATDFGPTAFVDVSASNRVVIPWLNEAQNVIYELDGGPHKMPGTTKNFTSALESGANIMGVYDAWFSGTSGSPAQHRIVHVGTKIKNDSADDTFVDLFTGMTAGAVPAYSMLEDLLVMSNDSGTDVPKSWDGATAQNLAGSPPTFAFSVEHKNKLWAAGDKSQPSRLYYSVDFLPADWTNSGSGHIDISPSDGDRITGLRSYRNELWVFKGPYKGSIHRISGSAPTGSDAFARATFVTGIGSVNHNGLVPYANDMAFMWSDGTIRSVSATNQFGDFDQSTLSQPINGWIRDHVNRTQLKKAWAVDWPEYGILLFAVPIDGSTVPNCLLMMDYRFSPPRWAKWSALNNVVCLAQAESISSGITKRTILGGGSDGILRTMGNATRSLDGSTSIPYVVQPPYLDYDVANRMKTLEYGSICFNPKNAGNVTLGWSRDGMAQDTVTVSQGTGQALLGSFLLGTDILGGGRFFDAFTRFNEAGGEFRAVQYQLSNNVAGEDVEVHSFSTGITLGAESLESA